MKKQFADKLPEGWDEFAEFFSALGDSTRQKILLLFEAGEEICVNEIASAFPLPRGRLGRRARPAPRWQAAAVV